MPLKSTEVSPPRSDLLVKTRLQSLLDSPSRVTRSQLRQQSNTAKELLLSPKPSVGKKHTGASDVEASKGKEKAETKKPSPQDPQQGSSRSRRSAFAVKEDAPNEPSVMGRRSSVRLQTVGRTRSSSKTQEGGDELPPVRRTRKSSVSSTASSVASPVRRTRSRCKLSPVVSLDSSSISISSCDVKEQPSSPKDSSKLTVKDVSPVAPRKPLTPTNLSNRMSSGKKVGVISPSKETPVKSPHSASQKSPSGISTEDPQSSHSDGKSEESASGKSKEMKLLTPFGGQSSEGKALSLSAPPLKSTSQKMRVRKLSLSPMPRPLPSNSNETSVKEGKRSYHLSLRHKSPPFIITPRLKISDIEGCARSPQSPNSKSRVTSPTKIKMSEGIISPKDPVFMKDVGPLKSPEICLKISKLDASVLSYTSNTVQKIDSSSDESIRSTASSPKSEKSPEKLPQVKRISSSLPELDIEENDDKIPLVQVDQSSPEEGSSTPSEADQLQKHSPSTPQSSESDSASPDSSVDVFSGKNSSERKHNTSSESVSSASVSSSIVVGNESILDEPEPAVEGSLKKVSQTIPSNKSYNLMDSRSEVKCERKVCHMEALKIQSSSESEDESLDSTVCDARSSQGSVSTSKSMLDSAPNSGSKVKLTPSKASKSKCSNDIEAEVIGTAGNASPAKSSPVNISDAKSTSKTCTVTKQFPTFVSEGKVSASKECPDSASPVKFTSRPTSQSQLSPTKVSGSAVNKQSPARASEGISSTGCVLFSKTSSGFVSPVKSTPGSTTQSQSSSARSLGSSTHWNRTPGSLFGEKTTSKLAFEEKSSSKSAKLTLFPDDATDGKDVLVCTYQAKTITPNSISGKSSTPGCGSKLPSDKKGNHTPHKSQPLKDFDKHTNLVLIDVEESDSDYFEELHKFSKNDGGNDIEVDADSNESKNTAAESKEAQDQGGKVKIFMSGSKRSSTEENISRMVSPSLESSSDETAEAVIGLFKSSPAHSIAKPVHDNSSKAVTVTVDVESTSEDDSVAFLMQGKPIISSDTKNMHLGSTSCEAKTLFQDSHEQICTVSDSDEDFMKKTNCFEEIFEDIESNREPKVKLSKKDRKALKKEQKASMKLQKITKAHNAQPIEKVHLLPATKGVKLEVDNLDLQKFNTVQKYKGIGESEKDKKKKENNSKEISVKCATLEHTSLNNSLDSEAKKKREKPMDEVLISHISEIHSNAEHKTGKTAKGQLSASNQESSSSKRNFENEAVVSLVKAIGESGKNKNRKKHAKSESKEITVEETLPERGSLSDPSKSKLKKLKKKRDLSVSEVPNVAKVHSESEDKAILSTSRKLDGSSKEEMSVGMNVKTHLKSKMEKTLVHSGADKVSKDTGKKRSVFKVEKISSEQQLLQKDKDLESSGSVSTKLVKQPKSNSGFLVSATVTSSDETKTEVKKKKCKDGFHVKLLSAVNTSESQKCLPSEGVTASACKRKKDVSIYEDFEVTSLPMKKKKKMKKNSTSNQEAVSSTHVTMTDIVSSEKTEAVDKVKKIGKSSNFVAKNNHDRNVTVEESNKEKRKSGMVTASTESMSLKPLKIAKPLITCGENSQEVHSTLVANNSIKSLKKQKKIKKHNDSEMLKVSKSTQGSDSDDAPTSISFSAGWKAALADSKAASESIKAQKDRKKEKAKELQERRQQQMLTKAKKHGGKGVENYIIDDNIAAGSRDSLGFSHKKSALFSAETMNVSKKRLPPEVIESLSEQPPSKMSRNPDGGKHVTFSQISAKELKQQKKKQKKLALKLEKQKTQQQEYIPLETDSGATRFGIVPLRNIMASRNKLANEAVSFRKEMLFGQRIKRTPISAYLAHEEKLKAAFKDKF